MLSHIRDVIALDPGWYGDMYEVNPMAGLEVALMDLTPWFFTPEWFNQHLTTAEKVRELQTFFHRLWTDTAPQDARDIYYQLDAWENNDVGKTPGFNGNTEAALGSIQAKTLLIAIKEDMLVRREEMLFGKGRNSQRRLYRNLLARRSPRLSKRSKSG